MVYAWQGGDDQRVNDNSKSDILLTSGEPQIMRHAIVIEHSEPNLAGYVPDFPGCATTGQTVEEIVRNMRGRLSSTLKLPNEAKKALRLLNLYLRLRGTSAFLAVG
jgi:predicted RNase H-like HicB family nuclease